MQGFNQENTELFSGQFMLDRLLLLFVYAEPNNTNNSKVNNTAKDQL